MLHSVPMASGWSRARLKSTLFGASAPGKVVGESRGIMLPWVDRLLSPKMERCWPLLLPTWSFAWSTYNGRRAGDIGRGRSALAVRILFQSQGELSGGDYGKSHDPTLESPRHPCQPVEDWSRLARTGPPGRGGKALPSCRHRCVSISAILHPPSSPSLTEPAKQRGQLLLWSLQVSLVPFHPEPYHQRGHLYES